MGLPLVHENHYLLSLEMLQTTPWGCVSTRDEICAEGTQLRSKAGRGSAWFGSIDPGAGMNQAGGNSVIHTTDCSARTSTGSGFEGENEEERFL